jgi:hypothetical protein
VRTTGKCNPKFGIAEREPAKSANTSYQAATPDFAVGRAFNFRAYGLNGQRIRRQARVSAKFDTVGIWRTGSNDERAESAQSSASGPS